MDYQFYKLALKYLLASKILNSTLHLFVLSFQYNENIYIYPDTFPNVMHILHLFMMKMHDWFPFLRRDPKTFI